MVMCPDGKYRNITFQIPENVIVLDVSHNKLAKLQDGDLQGCFSLLELDLSSNEMKMVAKHAFDSLFNLRKLDLSRNELWYGKEDSLPTFLFEQIPNLKYLKIEGNENDLDDGNLTIFFQSFPLKIEVLHIDLPDDKYGTEANFSEFSSFMCNLTNLSELGMYGTFGSICNESFQRLASLPIKKVKIYLDMLDPVIGSLAFAWFPHLIELDLSYTAGLSIQDFLLQAQSGLAKTTLNVLKLNSFKNPQPNEVWPKQSWFRGLENLTELYLEDTNIARLYPLRDWKLPNLQYLSLAYNLVAETDLCQFLQALQRKSLLLDLNLSYQRRIPEDRNMPLLIATETASVVSLTSRNMPLLIVTETAFCIPE